MPASSSKKERLDLLLVERELAETRARARALVMAGQVLVDGHPSGKAGQRVPRATEITLRDAVNPFVSRGGLKLEGFLREFPFATERAIALDIGASTGGFTDCLLQRGARRVHAIDAGFGQLHQRLRCDPRVAVREKCNARELVPEDFDEPIKIFTIDVSFISIALIIPRLLPLAGDYPADLLVLVKPQFEAGKAEADRGAGVIRDPAIHRRVLGEAWDLLCREGWSPLVAAASGLEGPAGNREFFLGATRADCPRQPPFDARRDREAWLDAALRDQIGD